MKREGEHYNNRPQPGEKCLGISAVDKARRQCGRWVCGRKGAGVTRLWRRSRQDRQENPWSQQHARGYHHHGEANNGIRNPCHRRSLGRPARAVSRHHNSESCARPNPQKEQQKPCWRQQARPPRPTMRRLLLWDLTYQSRSRNGIRARIASG